MLLLACLYLDPSSQRPSLPLNMSSSTTATISSLYNKIKVAFPFFDDSMNDLIVIVILILVLVLVFQTINA